MYWYAFGIIPSLLDNVRSNFIDFRVKYIKKLNFTFSI